MTRPRPATVAIVLSVLLHAGFVLVLLNRKPAPAPTLYDVPNSIEVRVLPSSGPGSLAPDRFSEGGRPNSSQRARPSLDPHKLFALGRSASDLPTAPSAAQNEKASLSFQSEFDASGGRFSVEAWGEGSSNPFWTHFARVLHARIKFLQDLGELHESGQVFIRLKFQTDGSLDKDHLRSQSDESYLQIYSLREICRAFCSADAQFSRLISDNNPGLVRLRIRFSSSMRKDHETDPLPILKAQALEMERRLRISSFKIGKTKIFGSSGKNLHNSGNLSWGWDIESLFSASHRKRFGWSGSKIQDGEKRAFRQELNTLRSSYQKSGWI